MNTNKTLQQKLTVIAENTDQQDHFYDIGTCLQFLDCVFKDTTIETFIPKLALLLKLEINLDEAYVAENVVEMLRFTTALVEMRDESGLVMELVNNQIDEIASILRNCIAETEWNKHGVVFYLEDEEDCIDEDVLAEQIANMISKEFPNIDVELVA